jgi:hypothetical protein
MLESYVLGASGNYQGALEAAEVGLRADAADLSLRGNKAYALAGLRRFDEADIELKAIDSRGDSRLEPFSDATRGMIALLRGEASLGIALYEKALAEFQKRGNEEAVTTCYAFMARAAADSKASQASAILGRARQRFSKTSSAAAAVILHSIDSDVAMKPAEQLRRVTQWEWDSSLNTLTEKRGLTRKAAPSLVVKGKS